MSGSRAQNGDAADYNGPLCTAQHHSVLSSGSVGSTVARSTFTAALKDSARALSKQIPVRPTDCRIPSCFRAAANSADV